MKPKLKVIKIGGNVIDNATSLSQFLSDYSKIEGAKILVHGGGKLATKLNQTLGIKTKMVEGRRVTSSDDLDVVTMVYAGLINKTIVAQLQNNHCNALGLSGADANVLLAVKRPTEPIDYGLVGDVKQINAPFIDSLLQQNISPVFCAISHDGKGQLLNTNADTVTAEIAIAMSDVYECELVYCFEKNGVLENVEDENSVIQNIDSKKYESLKAEKKIHDGMLPKMENCFLALNKQVSKVLVGSPKAINADNTLHTTLSL